MFQDLGADRVRRPGRISNPLAAIDEIPGQKGRLRDLRSSLLNRSVAQFEPEQLGHGPAACSELEELPGAAANIEQATGRAATFKQPEQ